MMTKEDSKGNQTTTKSGNTFLRAMLSAFFYSKDGTFKQDYLKNIAHKIQGRTICAFGEACAWPVLSFVDKFRDKFDERGAEDEARLAESQMKEGVN